jgi:sulfur-oxidizing protein SoxY
MNFALSRRQALMGGASAVLVLGGVGLVPGRARAETNEYRDAIMAFTGGVEPETGRVHLDLPEIAENGNTVPMNVSVDSPMTAEDHCQAVLIVADGNPRPGVATFHFSPMSGRAEANTRIRLASTQNVIAVAQMSDGSYFMDTREVKVTIGGCGG